MASISPEVAVSSPASIRSRVDLPQPEAPTTVTNSPAPTSRAMLCRAGIEPRRVVNVLQTERQLMIAVMSSSAGVQPRERYAMYPSEHLIDGQPDRANENDAGEDLVSLQKALCLDD